MATSQACAQGCRGCRVIGTGRGQPEDGLPPALAAPESIRRFLVFLTRLWAGSERQLELEVAAETLLNPRDPVGCCDPRGHLRPGGERLPRHPAESRVRDDHEVGVVERGGPTVASKSTSGKEHYKCTKTNKEGQAYESTCTRDVTVSYREHAASLSLVIAGSARVIDVKSAEQLAAPSLSAEAADSVRWADAFAIGDRSITVTDGSVMVDSDISKLAKARQSLKDESDLASPVLDKLSSDTARAVIAAVDIEKPASDPATLTVRVLP